MNELIKYNDLAKEISKHTSSIVWACSIEDKINAWLNPVRRFANEKSQFYGFSVNRDCGWYVEKDGILDMLCNSVPKTNDRLLERNSKLILNSLQDFIIDYIEPQCKN